MVVEMLGDKLGLVDYDCGGFCTPLFSVTRTLENTVNSVLL